MVRLHLSGWTAVKWMLFSLNPTLGKTISETSKIRPELCSLVYLKSCTQRDTETTVKCYFWQLLHKHGNLMVDVGLTKSSCDNEGMSGLNRTTKYFQGTSDLFPITHETLIILRLFLQPHIWFVIYKRRLEAEIYQHKSLVCM